MKTSTTISPIHRIVGYEKAVEMIGRAGFDGWDFSLCDMWKYTWEGNYRNKTFFFNEECPLSKPDYLEFVRRLRRIGEDNGIVCDQSHAPYPLHIAKYNECEYFFKRAIECTAEAGGKICVIHPDNDATAEENGEAYLKLLPFAREHGVKIATENMWNWNVEEGRAIFAACASHEDFKAHLDYVNDEYFVACLDVGHAEIMGDMTSAEKMIYTLKDGLQSLHIHDVDKRNDNHEIPFSLSVDFEKIAKALRDINYKGWLTLEACNYITNKKFDESNIFEGVVELYKSAAKFEKMFLGE